MKITLSKVSQTLCCGKLRLKETFDKKVMSQTPLQKLYTRLKELLQEKIDSVTGKTKHLTF